MSEQPPLRNRLERVVQVLKDAHYAAKVSKDGACVMVDYGQGYIPIDCKSMLEKFGWDDKA